MVTQGDESQVPDSCSRLSTIPLKLILRPEIQQSRLILRDEHFPRKPGFGRILANDHRRVGDFIHPGREGQPVYEVLLNRGRDVIVANAREARTVPGRKIDVNDA